MTSSILSGSESWGLPLLFLMLFSMLSECSVAISWQGGFSNTNAQLIIIRDHHLCCTTSTSTMRCYAWERREDNKYDVDQDQEQLMLMLMVMAC
jgi:hypothetical protein